MFQRHPQCLIIRFSSIGDIALTLPVLDYILSKYGPASADYVTKKHFAPLVKYHPAVNTVYSPENEKNLMRLRFKIKKNNYGHILDLHKNVRSLLLTLGLSRVRRVHKGILKRFLLTRFKIYRPPYLHVTEKYLQTLGVEETVSSSRLPLPPEEVIKEENRTDFRLITGGGQTLVLAPGASKPSKMLPFETWEKVLIVLRDRFKHIYILGNGTEENRWAQKIIRDPAYGPVKDLTKRLTLEELMLFLSRATLFAGNDSGPAHLAALSGIPTLVIFGQTVPEYGFTPLNNTRLIEPPVHLVCRPCGHLGHRRCPKGHHDCMKTIDPDTIINNIIHILANDAPHDRTV